MVEQHRHLWQTGQIDILAAKGVVYLSELGAVLVVPAVAVAPYPLGGGPGRVLLGRVVALANRADPRVFPGDVVNTGRHG